MREGVGGWVLEMGCIFGAEWMRSCCVLMGISTLDALTLEGDVTIRFEKNVLVLL